VRDVDEPAEPRSAGDNLLAFLFVPAILYACWLVEVVVLHSPVVLPTLVQEVLLVALIVFHGLGPRLAVLTTLFGWAVLVVGRKRPLRGPLVDALVATLVGLVLAVMTLIVLAAARHL
jgi:hypothetical protein